MALGADRPGLVAPLALGRGHLAGDRDVDLLRRRAADVADAAVVGEPHAVVAARADRHLVLRDAGHLELRAGMADVGVAGDALVAGLAQTRVVHADVVVDLVSLELRLGMALDAVVGPHGGRERALVGVGHVQDEVGEALEVPDEVVEHARLGVALLAAHAGAVVGGLLVGGDLGLDEVARSQVLMLLTEEKAMMAPMKTTTRAATHAEQPRLGDSALEEHLTLGELVPQFLEHGHWLPSVGVGVGRGAGVYLRPLKRLWARGSPAACCS